MRNFLLSATMAVTGVSVAFSPAFANAEDAGFGDRGVFVPYDTFDQLSQSEQDALISAGEAAASSDEIAGGGCGNTIPRSQCGGTYWYWNSNTNCCTRRRKDGSDGGGNA